MFVIMVCIRVWVKIKAVSMHELASCDISVPDYNLYVVLLLFSVILTQLQSVYADYMHSLNCIICRHQVAIYTFPIRMSKWRHNSPTWYRTKRIIGAHTDKCFGKFCVFNDVAKFLLAVYVKG